MSIKILTPRHYRGEIDLEAIAQLLNSSRSAHQFHEWPSPAEMLMQLETPSVDKQRDICLWEDSDSQVMAIAGLMIPEIGEDIAGILWFRVNPQTKGNNLEAQILEWGEKRMREVGRERNVKVKVLSGGNSDNVERIALLEILTNYKAMISSDIIAVFDAYNVKGRSEELQTYNNIFMIFTKEAHTADHYIEHFVHKNIKDTKITVVTSDRLEQTIIRSKGANLLSATDLKVDIESKNKFLLEKFSKDKSEEKVYFSTLLDN